MATITITDSFELILESLENYQLNAGTLSPKFECPEDSVMSKELRELGDFIEQFEHVYRTWLSVCGHEKGGHLAKIPILASLGTRTPEFNYEEAILESLMQFEGRGDYDEVIDEIGETFELSPADKERSPSYPFNPRWSVAVFNAILQLVHRGWIREEDNGMLILTEKGREAFSKHTEEHK
jgi:Mrr N-terminal domain